MRPGVSNSHTPPENRSMPRWSCRKVVTNPDSPMVAMKANASVTPPSWASTPEAAVTARRSGPSRGPLKTAHASRAPTHRAGHGGHPRQLDAAGEGAQVDALGQHSDGRPGRVVAVVGERAR